MMKNRTTLPRFAISGILFLSLLMFTVVGCKKEGPSLTLEAKYRVIAWNYLDENAKANIRVDWKIAPVTYLTQDNKDLAAVMFNTTDDALLGPIIVYIAVKTKVVQGIGPRF